MPKKDDFLVAEKVSTLFIRFEKGFPYLCNTDILRFFSKYKMWILHKVCFKPADGNKISIFPRF